MSINLREFAGLLRQENGHPTEEVEHYFLEVKVGVFWLPAMAPRVCLLCGRPFTNGDRLAHFVVREYGYERSIGVALHEACYYDPPTSIYVN